LQHDRQTDGHSDDQPTNAAGHYQNERLHEVHESNPCLGVAHRSQKPNLFRLVKQVSTHTGAQREEAQEHRNGNDDVEDPVEDPGDQDVGLQVRKVVLNCDSLQLIVGHGRLQRLNHRFDVLFVLRLLKLYDQSLPHSFVQGRGSRNHPVVRWHIHHKRGAPPFV